MCNTSGLVIITSFFPPLSAFKIHLLFIFFVLARLLSQILYLYMKEKMEELMSFLFPLPCILKRKIFIFVIGFVYFSWTFSFLLDSTYLTQRKMKIRGRGLLWFIELFLVLLSVCLPYFWNTIKGNGLSGLVHVNQLFAPSLKSPSHMH